MCMIIDTSSRISLTVQRRRPSPIRPCPGPGSPLALDKCHRDQISSEKDPFGILSEMGPGQTRSATDMSCKLLPQMLLQAIPIVVSQCRSAARSDLLLYLLNKAMQDANELHTEA